MAFEIALSGGVGTVLATAGLVARAAAAATITSNMTNASGDITLTAKANGYDGNDIAVTYVDPAENSASLSVDVRSKDIFVYLATDASGEITSTAALVKAAINADSEASVLVTAEDEANGAGVVNALARAKLSGGVDGHTLTTGTHFRVESFDATNAKILPFHPAADGSGEFENPGTDWFKSTDVCTVAISTIVTACTAP